MSKEKTPWQLFAEAMAEDEEMRDSRPSNLERLKHDLEAEPHEDLPLRRTADPARRMIE